jgi:PKD repeat protein
MKKTKSNQGTEKRFKLIIFFSITFTLLFFILMIQNIVVAQAGNQELPSQSGEPFSVVLTLDPAGETTIDYSYRQNNLLAMIYGNSNLLVFNLDNYEIIYQIAYPDSHLLKPYLLENKLIYLKKNNNNYQTICVDLFAEEGEYFSLQGVFQQVTDNGYLIISDHGIHQIIDPETGTTIFEPEISKGGESEILCVDDVIIFPFNDSRKNPAGYKAMSTSGLEIFTIPEIFNELNYELPGYQSKISSFPFPVIRKEKNLSRNEWHWFLEYINREGAVVASYLLDELNLSDSDIKSIDSLFVVDENQNGHLLEFRYSREGESLKFHYIFTDLFGNIIKLFEEEARCDIGFDSQGNILLFPRGGSLRDILQYYQEDGTLLFNLAIPCLVTSGMPREFRFPGIDEVLGWEYNQFTKYSLDTGQMMGFYPLSTDYQIYDRETFIYHNQVYFFARPRGGCEPRIIGSNYYSFSAADSGWLDVDLVFIRPNAGSNDELWDNTEVKVRFKTEYDYYFGSNLTVNFEKGEVLSANQMSLEYTWRTPSVIDGNQDTICITVSYGPVSREFIITVKDPVPVASFVYQPVSPQTGQEILFDASKSFDPDGQIVSYQWDFGDGTVAQEQQESVISHQFTTVGEYPVALTVTDNNDQTATINQAVQVTKAPEPPIADFKVLDPSPQWDTRVRFDASLSSDPDGSIVSYQWDFGDETTGEGINVSHEFEYENRNFDVTLTVTDNQNLSSSKTIKVSYGWILSYENKGDIGIPAALIDGNNLVDYQVTVITGNYDDAGTDSMVFIALYGPEKENGRYGSKEIQLWSYDYLENFEKGEEDIFNVQGYNLEEIEFITLRHKNDQDKPGWYVKSVKVKNTSTGKEWLFVPDQWLAMDEPPENQTWGLFYPVQQHSILFKWEERSFGLIEASDHIFILPENVKTFYFRVLNRNNNLDVYRQEFLPNGSVRNTSIGTQSFTENPQGLSYSSTNITRPTRFLVKIKEGSTVREEATIWVFPHQWKDYKNEARKISLLYPLKGSTGVFLQGEQFKDYLTGLQPDITNASMPILKYGADSLKIFGSIPDETLSWYIKKPLENYTKDKAAKALATITGKTFTKITGEMLSVLESLYKAAEWGSKLDEVIEYATGELYKIDLLKDTGSNNVNFLQSLELLTKIKPKVDALIVSVENNDLWSCMNYINDIQALTVGNNPGSDNKNDYIIDYSDYNVSNFLKTSSESCHSFYSKVEDYPLFLILFLEISNIQSWRSSHHRYLDAYFGGGMSQAEINAALAEIGATPLMGLDTLQTSVGLSEEGKKNATKEAMNVYEPIIIKLIDLSGILIKASLLSAQFY